MIKSMQITSFAVGINIKLVSDYVGTLPDKSASFL